MARIVNIDSYNGDYPNEKFELFPMPEEDAKAVADLINDVAGHSSPRFWKVVPNDYKLAAKVLGQWRIGVGQ